MPDSKAYLHATWLVCNFILKFRLRPPRRLHFISNVSHIPIAEIFSYRSTVHSAGGRIQTDVLRRADSVERLYRVHNNSR